MKKYKYEGEFKNLGWDINTVYAIDEDGQCYMNHAHGDPVQPVSVEQLLASAEHDVTNLRKIKQLLGIPDVTSEERIAQLEQENLRLTDLLNLYESRFGKVKER